MQRVLLQKKVGIDYLGRVSTPRGKGLVFRRPKNGFNFHLRIHGTILRSIKVIQHEYYVQKVYEQITPTLYWLQPHLYLKKKMQLLWPIIKKRGVLGAINRFVEIKMGRKIF